MSQVGRVAALSVLLGGGASAAAAAVWYVDTMGNDANSCMAPGPAAACLTVQAAINKAASADTIHVAAGIYASGLVTVDKALTLLGAQAGVDARARVGAETVLSDAAGMRITASTVVIDGFTIQDSTLVFTGFGIFMDPSASVSGTRVVNNIIQNNEVGIGFANAGPSQLLIQHNLIQNNNQNPLAAAFGVGVYTDQFVGRQVTNVLIAANAFVGNQNAGVAFNNVDISIPDSNIEIANNSFDQNGQAIYFFNTISASVHDNQIDNTTLPTDGSSSKAITAFGDVDGLTIMNNDLNMGVNRGIRVLNLNVNPNRNVVIHLNNITNFVGEGLLVDPGGHVGPVDATCNWWGSPTGPTNPTNPAGTGEVVDGDATFDPWLLGPAPGGACGLSTTTTTAPSTSSTSITVPTSITITTTTTTTTTTTPEICGNCIDDNGNGLVDSEDLACCSTVQPLVVTQSSFRAGRVRVRAKFPDGTFAGFNPRHGGVHLQVRGAAGEVLCCTIPGRNWQNLFQHTFGFFEQTPTVCPPIKCMNFALPKKGQPQVTFVTEQVSANSPLLSPLKITISADDQCAAGPVSLAPKVRRGGVLP
jgi:hypothetical protein